MASNPTIDDPSPRRTIIATRPCVSKIHIGAPTRILYIQPRLLPRCSPSHHIGPGHHIPSTLPLKELPQVDVVILLHNHNDVVTLKHIYTVQVTAPHLILTSL